MIIITHWPLLLTVWDIPLSSRKWPPGPIKKKEEYWTRGSYTPDAHANQLGAYIQAITIDMCDHQASFCDRTQERYGESTRVRVGHQYVIQRSLNGAWNTFTWHLPSQLLDNADVCAYTYSSKELQNTCRYTPWACINGFFQLVWVRWGVLQKSQSFAGMSSRRQSYTPITRLLNSSLTLVMSCDHPWLLCTGYNPLQTLDNLFRYM